MYSYIKINSKGDLKIELLESGIQSYNIAAGADEELIDNK